LPAPRPSMPSCAPPRVCASGQPAAGSRLHTAIQQPFVPTTIRGELQDLSQPHDSQSRPARAQAPLALHPGRRAGSGGSSPGGRDGRPPDHRAHARTPDPGGNDQADGRGAVVVFVAHLKMPAEVQYVHHDDDSGAGLLRLLPHPAESRSRVAALAPLASRSPKSRCHALPSDTPGHPTTWMRKSDPLGGTRTRNHPNPASLPDG